MDGTVRLKLARMGFFSGGGFSGSFVPISVKVKNIAFSKDVTIHYTTDGTNWKDASLAFSTHFDDYDIFGGSVNEQITQFVLRYAANGQLFWDNNEGHNYHFSPNLAIVGGNIALNIAKARIGTQAGGGFVFTTSWLEGEILVNNLSFDKQLGVRVSVDGGTNWEDTFASFSGTVIQDGIFIGPGAEVWKFKTPELNLNNASPHFRFAVFYHNIAGGEVFWDNNFGQDYKVSKVDGSRVE